MGAGVISLSDKIFIYADSFNCIVSPPGGGDTAGDGLCPFGTGFGVVPH